VTSLRKSAPEQNHMTVGCLLGQHLMLRKLCELMWLFPALMSKRRSGS
jgi:hypothetical protein